MLQVKKHSQMWLKAVLSQNDRVTTHFVKAIQSAGIMGGQLQCCIGVALHTGNVKCCLHL